YPVIGDERGRVLREIATEKAHAEQKVQWAVAPGARIKFHDGRQIGTGTEVTLEDVQGRRDAIAKLITLGVISVISPREAWIRSLPSDVGPFVWAGKKPRELANGDF